MWYSYSEKQESLLMTNYTHSSTNTRYKHSIMVDGTTIILAHILWRYTLINFSLQKKNIQTQTLITQHMTIHPLDPEVNN